jgi:hypothetical protein
MEPTHNEKIKFLPGKRKRAKANPHIVAVMTPKVTDGTIMSAVLHKYRQYGK